MDRQITKGTDRCMIGWMVGNLKALFKKYLTLELEAKNLLLRLGAPPNLTEQHKVTCSPGGTLDGQQVGRKGGRRQYRRLGAAPPG